MPNHSSQPAVVNTALCCGCPAAVKYLSWPLSGVYQMGARDRGSRNGERGTNRTEDAAVMPINPTIPASPAPQSCQCRRPPRSSTSTLTSAQISIVLAAVESSLSAYTALRKVVHRGLLERTSSAAMCGSKRRNQRAALGTKYPDGVPLGLTTFGRYRWPKLRYPVRPSVCAGSLPRTLTLVDRLVVEKASARENTAEGPMHFGTGLLEGSR